MQLIRTSVRSMRRTSLAHTGAAPGPDVARQSTDHFAVADGRRHRLLVALSCAVRIRHDIGETRASLCNKGLR